jgi:hypothetical protein
MDAPEFDPSRAVWRTSSFSNNGGACVEVADNLSGIVAVRDSKDSNGPVLLLAPVQWREFITGLRANAVSAAG